MESNRGAVVRQEGSGEVAVMPDEVLRQVEDGRVLSPTAWRPVGEPVRFQLSRALDAALRRAGYDDPKSFLDSLALAGNLTVCVERAADDTRPVVAEVVGDGRS